MPQIMGAILLLLKMIILSLKGEGIIFVPLLLEPFRVEFTEPRVSNKLEDLPSWAQDLVLNSAIGLLKHERYVTWIQKSETLIEFCLKKNGNTFYYWASKNTPYIY